MLVSRGFSAQGCSLGITYTAYCVVGVGGMLCDPDLLSSPHGVVIDKM